MNSIFLNRKKTIISKYKLTGQEKNNYSCMIASSGRGSSRSVCLINVSANDVMWHRGHGRNWLGTQARNVMAGLLVTRRSLQHLIIITAMCHLNRCHTRHHTLSVPPQLRSWKLYLSLVSGGKKADIIFSHGSRSYFITEASRRKINWKVWKLIKKILLCLFCPQERISVRSG